MASIESLLNPLPDLGRFPIPNPSLTPSSTGTGTSRPRQKRQKIAKDAPVFNKGKIRGELRYPPCEERDEELTRIHREFGIHPMGDIASYPRHIPYNSDKKSFQERTGREFFEVFQYTFKIPGEDKEWIVMWDYNIGLVRITHLFKCNEYSKTTPGKMLNANPGLRDICHSITGGALAAQGYWMPYDAAKAVAATFCWKIRHALTPVFGLDFPSQCIHPQDRARFGRMVIDPSIVRKATETANLYRMWELRTPPLLSSSFQHHSTRPSSPSPTERGDGFAARKQLLFPRSHRKHADSLSTSTTSTSASTISTASSSGYGSSPEYGSDTYCVSPVSPYRNTFTPVNTPRSADVVYNKLRIPKPQEILVSVSEKAGMGMGMGVGMGVGMVSDEDGTTADDNNTETSSTMYSPSSLSASYCPSLDLNDDDEKNEDHLECDNHADKNPPAMSTSSDNIVNGKEPTRSSSHRGPLFAKEVKAAHALLSLHMQDASGSDGEGEGEGEGYSLSSLMGVHQQYGHGIAQGLGLGLGLGQAQGRKRRRASA